VPGATANCLDTQATIDAVTGLKAADVKTYVIGMQGSEPYERQLDQLAVAGGTARDIEPRYYRVDTADAQALTEALTRVVNDILASCTVTLAGPYYDPANVVVQEQDVPVPQDPQNGWTLAGDRLTFHGASCDKLLANDRAGLTIHAGCNP
jgi:hypothetical protein